MRKRTDLNCLGNLVLLLSGAFFSFCFHLTSPNESFFGPSPPFFFSNSPVVPLRFLFCAQTLESYKIVPSNFFAPLPRRSVSLTGPFTGLRSWNTGNNLERNCPKIRYPVPLHGSILGTLGPSWEPGRDLAPGIRPEEPLPKMNAGFHASQKSKKRLSSSFFFLWPE